MVFPVLGLQKVVVYIDSPFTKRRTSKKDIEQMSDATVNLRPKRLRLKYVVKEDMAGTSIIHDEQEIVDVPAVPTYTGLKRIVRIKKINILPPCHVDYSH